MGRHADEANYQNAMIRQAATTPDPTTGYVSWGPGDALGEGFRNISASAADREEAHDAASRDYMELAAGITAAYGALRYYNASQADDTYEDEQPRRPRRDGFIKGLVKDFIKAL